MIQKFITDWEAIKIEVSVIDWDQILYRSSIADNWFVFKNRLYDVVSRNSHVVTQKKSSTKPWILKLIRRKRNLWKVFKRSGIEFNYASHRVFSNKLFLIIREARSKYEQLIFDHKNPEVFYKYIRTPLTSPVKIPR